MDYQRIAVFLIGNATRDGRVRRARESGIQYGEFRLAVRQRDGQTVYYPVVCFDGLAGGVAGITKGTKVFVDGDLELSSFVGDDGQMQMSFRVVAHTYRILGAGRRLMENKSEVTP